MNKDFVASRIPSELSDGEVRAIRCDNRLQREIAQEFGLTLYSVSLIKSRKCRFDVSEHVIQPQPVVLPPEPPKIVVFVCPPAKASGHKPLRKQMLKLKPVAESWQPTTRAISAPITDAVTPPSMPHEYHPDDWLLF